MPECGGCGKQVKRSGIYPHCERSKDRRCKEYMARLRAAESDVPTFDRSSDYDAMDDSDFAINEPPTLDMPEEGNVAEDSPSSDRPDEHDATVETNDVDQPDDQLDYDSLDDDSPSDTTDEEEDHTATDEEEDHTAMDAALALAAEGIEAKRPSPPPADDADDSSEPAYTLVGTRRPATRLRGGAEPQLEKRPYIVTYPSAAAGAVYRASERTENSRYGELVGEASQTNPYAPFTSQLEWEMAMWAKLRGPSSTAFTELMAIEGVQEQLKLSYKNTRELNKLIDEHLPGRPPFERHDILVGEEVCEVYFRDIIACIRSLFGDPDFAPYLVFKPEKHYTDEARQERMYHDMHTGEWWWATQAKIETDKPGATIVPIIISTDKTQLTLFRNKNAYPIYMTIGNIPKEIRRRPSSRAYILLGYLPTSRLEHVTNKSAKRRMITNLYHACLARILEPLVSAGEDGVHMSTASGEVHRNHLILASFIGDYPEQVLTTCTLTGDCPQCEQPRNSLGDFDVNQPPPLRNLRAILRAIDSFDSQPDRFLQTCSANRLKPVPRPFWNDLPYMNIYRSITPDVLHQLYQGIVKHLIAWVTTACGAAEIDARCRRMPQNHNIRLFTKGISSLSRVTGQEHDQMCRFLLGLIIDIRLPNRLSNVRLLRSVRALLDFVYFSQYPIHTATTLSLLQDALARFHENKSIFQDLQIRDNFNIPKLHFASHYVELIKLFGTTDNFNTQYTERLHIDLAKDAYAATNHKDEYEQMTVWLHRREKVLRHGQYVRWRLAGSPMPEPVQWIPPGLDLGRERLLAKHPSSKAVPLDQLQNRYGATFFVVALRRYISKTNNPRITPRDLESSLWNVHLPFRSLPAWHVIKFLRTDPVTGTSTTADSIHACPARSDKHGRPIHGRFDTALINDGTGGAHGVKGYRVGRIHVLFSIPPRYHVRLFEANVPVPAHLAYVEWYSAFGNPDPNHGMFKVAPLKDRDGQHICSIISVANICRSVHLLPKFGPVAPVEWTSSNVLDLCPAFFVSNFTDKHLFRTLFDTDE
ncbi:hypothetical protein JOM56_013076 [Amanita muscaria]